MNKIIRFKKIYHDHFFWIFNSNWKHNLCSIFLIECFLLSQHNRNSMVFNSMSSWIIYVIPTQLKFGGVNKIMSEFLPKTLQRTKFNPFIIIFWITVTFIGCLLFPNFLMSPSPWLGVSPCPCSSSFIEGLVDLPSLLLQANT